MSKKEMLIQYTDMKQEIQEIQAKINQAEEKVHRLERRLILQGDEEEKIRLLEQKHLLRQRKQVLDELELKLLAQTNEVEEFIAGIHDSRMRRIISLRFVENLSWNRVADYISGGNTEDSVRKAFVRFMQKAQQTL